MASGAKTVWKGVRLDEEIVVCMEEALQEGELNAMIAEAITRHGRLAECRRCGAEFERPRRLVDRFCEGCYQVVTPEVLRRYIDLSIPPGQPPTRSAVDATRYPEWVYEPATEPAAGGEWRGWTKEEEQRAAGTPETRPVLESAGKTQADSRGTPGGEPPAAEE